MANNEELIKAQLKAAGITNPYSVAAIMAIIGKESGFVPQVENDYSTTTNSSIRTTFSRHRKLRKLSETELTNLKKNPQAFFNFIYANTSGNSSTDGYKYRGRGFNQLTGKGNYEYYGNLLGLDLVSNPDLVNNPAVAARIAALFFIEGFKNNSGTVKRRYGASNINDFKDATTAVNAFYNANAGFGKDTRNRNTPGKRRALKKVNSYLDPSLVSSRSQIYPPPVDNTSNNSVPVLKYDPNTVVESEPLVLNSQLSPMQSMQTPQINYDEGMPGLVTNFTKVPQFEKTSIFERIFGNGNTRTSNPFVEPSSIQQPQIQQSTIQQPIVQPSFEEQITQQPIVAQPTVSQTSTSQVANDEDWIKKILNYEATSGGFDPVQGKAIGLTNWGYNNWQNLGHQAAPTSIDEAAQYFKQDFLPKVSQYPSGLKERAADYAYNTGRNFNDLLLYNSGLASLDEVNSDDPNVRRKLDDLWNQNKSTIESNYSDPSFIRKLDESKSNIYKTTGSYPDPADPTKGIKFSLANPNPKYDATWKGRIGLFGDVNGTNTQQPVVAQNTAVKTPPAAVVQTPPATAQTTTNQTPPPVRQYTPSNMLRASGDEDAEGSVSDFLKTNPNTQTVKEQAPLGSNTGATINKNVGAPSNMLRSAADEDSEGSVSAFLNAQPIATAGTTNNNTAGTNTAGTTNTGTTTNTTGTTTTTQTPSGKPSDMLRAKGYQDDYDYSNPPHGVDPVTGVDPYKVEWLKDAVRNQNTELKDIKISQPKVIAQANHYKPYDINPFTTALNLFNPTLNTIGGMYNMGRMREQASLNSFISQQPEAIYPNKRMLYGDKSMFAQYGGEYSEGGMYPEGGSVYQPEENIGELVQYKKGGIYIKPENKGKFTAWANAHGMSVQEAASHVMANKDQYSSTTVKRANFAKNASKFKHEYGGQMYPDGGEPMVPREPRDRGASNILDYTAGEDRSYWNPVSRYFSPLNRSFRQAGVSGDQKDSMLNTMFGSGPVNYNVRPRTYDPLLVKEDYGMDNSVYNPPTPAPAATNVDDSGDTPYNIFLGNSAYKTYSPSKAKAFAELLGAKWDNENNAYTYDKVSGKGTTWIMGYNGKLYPSQEAYDSGNYKNPIDPALYGMGHFERGGQYSYGGHYIPQDVPYLAGKFVPNPIDLEILANGGMIKRADGTYSRRGLWDNIRDNKGSGKKPTKEMLKQEKKIKKGYKAGGEYMEGNEYEISGAELERLKSLGYEVEMI